MNSIYGPRSSKLFVNMSAQKRKNLKKINLTDKAGNAIEESLPEIALVFHIRRCHVCGTVNQLLQCANLKCGHCGKHLAPFYYFNESEMKGLSDQGLHLSLMKVSKEYNPIWGLSTYWSESNEGDN